MGALLEDDADMTRTNLYDQILLGFIQQVNVCMVEVELALHHCHGLVQKLFQIEDSTQLVGNKGSCC